MFAASDVGGDLEVSPAGDLRRKHARLSDEGAEESDASEEAGVLASNEAATQAMVAGAGADKDTTPITPLYSSRHNSRISRRSSLHNKSCDTTNTNTNTNTGRGIGSLLLTPVRASRTEQESLGADVVFTPVRRSRRTVRQQPLCTCACARIHMSTKHACTHAFTAIILHTTSTSVFCRFSVPLPCPFCVFFLSPCFRFAPTPRRQASIEVQTTWLSLRAQLTSQTLRTSPTRPLMCVAGTRVRQRACMQAPPHHTRLAHRRA